jgi:hypothetical protein
MNRREILTLFRADNPEITDRVMSDAVAYSYLLEGDKEACAISRCIVGDTTFSSVVSSTVYEAKYDLTALITNFYAIDDNPGGGVVFDDDPLDKTTVAELDMLHSSWRSRSAGTPKKWYVRGNYLYFDYPIETAGLDIMVYSVLVSDDFDDDAKEPFNSLQHLRPFHSALVKYLQWKGKEKIGKIQEGVRARQEFVDYCKWFGKEIGGNKYGKIYLKPKAGYAK